MSNDTSDGVKDEDWASDDDPDDLLSGVLNETEEDAEQEREEVEQEIEEKRLEEQRKKQEEQERRRQEAERRITQEAQRLDELERRSTERQKAIQAEEARGEGEAEDEADETRDEMEAKGGEAAQAPPEEGGPPGPNGAQAQQPPADRSAVDRTQPTAAASQTAEPADEGSNRTMLFAIAGLVVLAAGLTGAIAYVKGGSTADDATYMKSVYSPNEPELLLVEKNFTPVNSDESEEEEDEDSEPTRRRRPDPEPTRSDTGGGGGEPSSSDQEEEDDAPELELDDTDPFSGGY